MGVIYGTPRVPRDTLSRARLSALLDTEAPLVIVRAPPGSGKTVAVADWANRRGPDAPSGVWFTVDDGGASRLGFWSAVIQLMIDAEVAPEKSVLQTSLPALESSPDLRRLLLRGFAQLSRELVLVVDDLHLVTDQNVLTDLRMLVEASPRLRVIVITRMRGELEFESVRISLGATTIETAELMFSLQETVQLLGQVGVSDPDGTLAAALWNGVGGLPLTTRGVLFMLEREEFDLDLATVQERLAIAGVEILRDVWVERSGDDPDIDFAIRSSIPDVLTVELAQELTGRSDAAEVLAIIESLGIGLWSDTATGPVFSYTPTIRSELRLELARRFPAEVKRLTRATAVWHLERGQHFAAISHAISIRDLDLAGTIAMQDYTRMLGVHGEELIVLLDGLPLNTLRKQPLVTMLLALALNMSGLHQARAKELFALAVVSARLHGAKANPAERTVFLAVESAAFRVTGQTRRSLAAAERTLAQYARLTLRERDRLKEIGPMLHTHTGLSFFYGGRMRQALESFQVAATSTAESPISRLHGLALSAGTHALNGDLPEAKVFSDLVRAEPWPDGQRDGYIGALYQVAEGVLALEAFDFAKAEQQVTVMELHLDTIEHWPLFMHLRAMSLLGRGRALEGATTLESAMSRGSRPTLTDFTRLNLDSTRALLLMAAGQLRAAERLLSNQPKNHPEVVKEWARYHLMVGRPEAARLALRSLEDTAFSSRLRTELLLLRAASALRLGERELALDTFERGLALLNDRGLRMPFALLPATDRRDLLAALRESGRGQGAPGLLDEFWAAPVLLAPALNPVALTEREHIVLEQLVRTSNAAEIAAELFVSANTVKSQLRSIYRKLGASSREDALRRAGEQGLLRG